MPLLNNFFRRFKNDILPDGDKKVYIPAGSDKGDCPHCLDGVLFRDYDIEKNFRTGEVYQCDICSRYYIEGININEWRANYKKSLRRYFIEAYEDRLSFRC